MMARGTKHLPRCLFDAIKMRKGTFIQRGEDDEEEAKLLSAPNRITYRGGGDC